MGSDPHGALGESADGGVRSNDGSTSPGTTSDASAAPDTTSSLPVEMTWLSVPTLPVTPGLVADPDPNNIQDDGLNSSVVLRVTRNGQPVVGEDVAWSSDDATSGIQAVSAQSDGDGRARAWYFAGKGATQKITARHVGTNQTLATSITRAATTSPTVGRYAATYYSAPPGAYSRYSVSVIPKAAPERTYYQVSSFWRTDGSFALYGGLQMSDCTNVTLPAALATCDASRGNLRGRQAIFSTWDWSSPTGVLAPIVVSSPSATSCQRFGGEGTGVQCFAPVAWDLDESWRWTLELLSGAPMNYQRVRIVLSNAAKSITQEIATVDVGGTIEMKTASAFNENWGGAPAASCLDVALRSMQITSMGFWNGSQWVKPASGKGMGGLYDNTMTRCQNYAFRAESGGLTVASGGTGLWINLADALVMDAATQQQTFTQDQLLWQWQSLDLSTIAVPTN